MYTFFTDAIHPIKLPNLLEGLDAEVLKNLPLLVGSSMSDRLRVLNRMGVYNRLSAPGVYNRCEILSEYIFFKIAFDNFVKYIELRLVQTYRG